MVKWIRSSLNLRQQEREFDPHRELIVLRYLPAISHCHRLITRMSNFFWKMKMTEKLLIFPIDLCKRIIYPFTLKFLVFANSPYQKLKKWYLMPPCLTLGIIRYRSRVRWTNPGKGVAPSPTPWCSSYRKGSLRVTLD